MKLNDTTKPILMALLYHKVPPEAFFDVSSAGIIEFQAADQAAVQEIRAAFPGTFWQKEYSESVNWWEYNGKTLSGLCIHIYACRQAPPACRAIVETDETEEEVPVQFETRTVIKERVRWECGSDAKGEDS